MHKHLAKTLFLITTFLIMACSEQSSSSVSEKEESTEKKKTGTFTKTNTKTKVKTEMTLKDGLKEGQSRQYYPSGKLWKESTYKGNKLDGISKIYHENGKLKRYSEYTNGKRNGKYEAYYKSGNLKASIQYDMDLPLPGIKEIDYTKKEVTQPKIQVRHEDKLIQNEYNLYFSLKAKDVKIYVMEEPEEWNSSTSLHAYTLPEASGGEFRLSIDIPPGYFFADEFFIYATYKSKTGLNACVTKRLNFAKENLISF